MAKVELKSLIRKLNNPCHKILEAAAGLCVSRAHYEITPEHLFSKMVEDLTGDVALILRRFEIETPRLVSALQRDLDDMKSGNPGKPVFSPLVPEWFQESWLVGSVDFGLTELRTGALFAGLLENPHRYLTGRAGDLIDEISKEQLKKEFFDIVVSSAEEKDTPKPAKPGEEGAPAGDTALARFTTDFTARAKKGEIDPVFGRDVEIRQIIDILAGRRKNNPIVVGDPGVGKTAVVEGLALRIAEADVPDLLKNVSLLGLDMGLLQAGAGVKGEFENRLKSVISEVKGSPKPIILFIDEAHTLIGAGAGAGGSDASNLLKPALARGELRTIAATTWSEYKKYFEKDAALARRFQLVKLDEPSVDSTVLMLRGLREKYEKYHNVTLLDEALVSAAQLSSRYISGRQLPDKAVDLVDTCAARVKIALSSKPANIDDLERKIQALERERSAYLKDQSVGAEVDGKRLSEIAPEIEKHRENLKGLVDRWQNEKKLVDEFLATCKKLVEEAKKTGAEGNGDLSQKLKAERDKLEKVRGKDVLIPVEVNPEVIARVVSDWTGIPVGKMVADDASAVLNFDSKLKERIKGQDYAVEMVAKGIRASKAGINDPSKPIGVFLFVGPSGVGKTECALGVADLLFGGERFITTINMSEFQEKHTVSRLIGSPPGYVGYGEGGVLTEAVRQRPYSVVLLDEVEKADPEVMNLFYQVFDKGMLSDGEGRLIDFKNTVVFMTSNLATDLITQMGFAKPRPTAEEITTAIRPTLNKHFKPALVGRMTVIPFFPLPPEALAEIVRLKLNRLVARLFDSHKMKLVYEDSVVEQITNRCREVETGARNIDHIMQGTLLPKISTELLQRMSLGPLPEKLTLGIDGGGEFTFRFSEGAPAASATEAETVGMAG
ncbi:MAG TPA: type VI secretion system ATPase TssH [Verrucomicrobiae bacterium]|nr:type VI secretion system ATPase TssH [Verrucomicrobiae bacterium]